MKEKIETVSEGAQMAFWAEVAKSYPEVTTGDLAPDVCFVFGEACNTAIEKWLESNHPDSEK